jgi:hypothetical protein
MDSNPKELIKQPHSITVVQAERLAENISSVPPEPAAAPSLNDINAVAETRHIEDRAWFLSNPTLWPERQQQVVAVSNRTILGQGADFVAAYEDAQHECAAHSKSCPTQFDLTFVIVPDVVDPEPAADWDPLVPAAR